MKKKTKKQKAKKRNMTDSEVAQIANSEGLDYAITSYMDSSAFVNLELARLWDDAKIILSQIEDILDKAKEEYDDDDDDDDDEDEDYDGE